MAESVLGRPRVVGSAEALRGRRGGKRWQLAIVLLVIASAVGYLVYSGLRTNVYYETVSELQASGGAHGRQVRVAGDVVDGSIVREEGSPVVHFQITDGTGGTLPVTYSGAVPDIFGPGIQVVVEGKYHSDTGFAADTMLAKCPSKFAAATPGQ